MKVHMSVTYQKLELMTLRCLSPSWALFHGASVKESLQAAHWASENIFTSFYYKVILVAEKY